MKCKQCGTEFEGNFCPKCGAKKIEVETSPPIQQQTGDQNYQQPAQTFSPTPPVKKKKPFYLRWWFILIVIFVIFIGVRLNGGKSRSEKIVWDDIVLGDIVPEPSGNRGEIHENSDEKLWVTINKITDKQFAKYVEACKEDGFEVDVEKNSSSFNAYNSEGYSLQLSHYSTEKKLSIQLEKPMEMSSIQWPSSTAGSLLPAPKSTKGKFSFENDNSFFVYVGNTTKENYDEYVAACSDKGFNINYDKGDTYYNADNADGWRVSLKYEGNSVMTIRIDAPDNSKNDDKTSEPEVTETPKTTEEPEEASNNSNNLSGVRSDFKKAMDSYEKFFDEYVAIMKKYKENPTDESIIADYTRYMEKYNQMVEDINEWKGKNMNAAETEYYIEVIRRTSEKLNEK